MNYMEMIRDFPDLLQDQLAAFKVTKLSDVIQSFLEAEEKRVEGVMKILPECQDKSFELGYKQGVIIESRRARAFMRNLEVRLEHAIKIQHDQRTQEQNGGEVPENRRPLGRGRHGDSPSKP